MFSETQIAALTAKLSPDHVKHRAQSGRNLSYIEGWHAIAEANRIFGFHAWTRETIEMRCVSERERTIGSSNASGWGVSYLARVRISVKAYNESDYSEIVREGYGTGHGIDRDLGQAHESAAKEAETDAMKRALMTFGNPFGLALYDKTQAMVGDDEPMPIVVKKSANQARKDGDFPKYVTAIRECTTPDMLKQWGTSHRMEIAALPDNWREELQGIYGERMVELRSMYAEVP